MENEQEEEVINEKDYYTFLNVPRNASVEQIHQAYRKHSKIFHPDKHVDPVLKKKAEILFNRVNKAYEVLSDPHQRAIYDSLGVRGLEIQGWEIVQRIKTPQEIRAEYERITKKLEETRLHERINPKGNITVNINATDLFNRYDEDYDDISNEIFNRVEISGISFGQSIEAPLTLKDTLMLYGQLDTQNGTGVGTVNLALRKAFSAKNWAEVDVGVGNGPTLSLKGCQLLTKRLFCTGTLQCKPYQSLLFVGCLGLQLDKQTAGYLTYKTGHQGSMSTMIVRDTPESHTTFNLQLGLTNTFIGLNYTYKVPEQKLKLRGAIKIGTMGGHIEYGAEKRVSKYSSLSASVRVGVPSGVILRLKVSHASHSYLFPIHLCEEVLTAPIFYATVAPLLTWTIVKKFIVDPVVKEQKDKEKQKQKELNKTRMLEKQKEAKAAVELMMASFSRIRAEEENKGGLVITKALYGRFVYSDRYNQNEDMINDDSKEVIDVTVPLQCLVINSRLVLHDAPKYELPGFYDPCIGEDKQLLVQYLFHRLIHQCLIKDNEPLRIPVQSHRVNTT